MLSSPVVLRCPEFDLKLRAEPQFPIAKPPTRLCYCSGFAPPWSHSSNLGRAYRTKLWSQTPRPHGKDASDRGEAFTHFRANRKPGALALTDLHNDRLNSYPQCLSPVVRATNVAMLATTLRSALRLSAFATTVSTSTSTVPFHDSRLLTIPTGKQPGHESNQCPLPRSTEAKQCYHCQGLGHVQADCPTLRLSGAGTGRCYNCNQEGHLAVSFEIISVIYALLMHHSATAPILVVLDLVAVVLSVVVALATAVVGSPAALVLPPATSAVVPTTLLGTAKRKP